MTTSLELGCDCLGEIAYLDASSTTPSGEPYTIKNAICIHEEDDAILWKQWTRSRAQRSAAPPARALLPRDRRQLRVPRLLAPLPGRQHRVRGPGDRDHGHHALRRGRAAPLRQPGRPAHVRAVPPALHRRPAGPRRRRRGEHRLPTETEALADRAREPVRARARAARHPAAHGVEGRQDYDWSTQRAWKVLNERPNNGLGRRSATSSCPAAASRR